MYSESLNVLFIHIPKCAGQTISTYLMGLDGVTWKNRGLYHIHQNGNTDLGPPQTAHFTLKEYRGSGLLSQQTIADAIKFTVVRNPWDRLWSEYNYHWSHICSWSHFFRYFPRYIFDDHKTGRDALQHIRPQVDFIDDTVEVLRFETLHDDFKAFCLRHEIPFNGFKNVVNVSGAAPYTEVYTPRKIAAVERFYSDDAAVFGYEPPL